MPYIERSIRFKIDSGQIAPANTGELNYAITKVVLTYLTTQGLKYATINDIIGALEGAKQEFYRRVAAPYEDKKRYENGEIYP